MSKKRKVQEDVNNVEEIIESIRNRELDPDHDLTWRGTCFEPDNVSEEYNNDN